MRTNEWGEAMEDVVTSVVQNAPIDEAVSAPAATAQESAAGLDEQTDKLNDLMDLVGELVIASASANLLAHRSGQYAGLDAVKQDIAALRGSVSVSSKPGEGSRFAIRLPLTLAIIDGFLVGVDKASYVIPLDNVVECIELKNLPTDRNFLNLRGEALPFVRLRELFELEGAPPPRENIVVVQLAGKRAGIVVDALMGEFQTVIKPLGVMFRHLRGIGGSTILGSGEVALILDVGALVHAVSQIEEQRAEGSSGPHKHDVH